MNKITGEALRFKTLERQALHREAEPLDPIHLIENLGRHAEDGFAVERLRLVVV